MLDQIITQLEAQLAEEHPTDHDYVPSRRYAATCSICGWCAPHGPTLRCGHTQREHVQRALKVLKALKEGSVPDMEGVEVDIILIPTSLWVIG